MKTDTLKNLKDRQHHKLIMVSGASIAKNKSMFPKRKIFVGLLTALIVLSATLAPFSIEVNSNRDAIAVQSNTAHAQTTVTQQVSVTDNLSNYAECGLIDGNLGGCVVQVFYYIWYMPTSWLLGASATFFNALAAVTLSSRLYTASQFISDAWKIVRDFSNILFIFVLIYAAIAIVLDLQVGGGNPKKVLTWVVIMAILVNFSMFFTKVVIDSTNVLALIFYNKIGATHQDTNGYTPTTNASLTGIEERDISGAIAAGFEPQVLTKPAFFDLLKQPPTLTYGLLGFSVEGGVPASTFLIIILISGMIFLYAAYAFFISGISFLGRMVQLWVSIIFSPFAFVSYIIPSFSSLPGLGFAAWSKTLVSAAISAPIFMFFMYLISLLTKADFISKISSLDLDGLTNLSTVQAILLVVIPLLIIMTLLIKATGYARKAGGEITDMIFKGAQAVAGVGVAGASLATGFAARAVIGRGAAALGGSEAIKRKAAENTIGGTIARFGLKTFEGVSKKSFDVRGTGAGKAVAGFTGIKLAEISGKGGWAGAREAAMKKDLEMAERLKTTKSDRELEDRYPANVKMRQEYEAKKKSYEDEFNKEREKQRTAQGLQFNEAQFKTAYEKEKKDKKEFPEPPKYKTADEINKERTATYAETLKAGTLATKAAGLVAPTREAEIAAGEKLAPKLSTAETAKYQKGLETLEKAVDRSTKRLEQIRDELKKFEEMTDDRGLLIKDKSPEDIKKYINETTAQHRVGLVDIESQIKTFENNFKNETDPQKKADFGRELKKKYIEKGMKEKELKDTENMLKDYTKNSEEEKKVRDRIENDKGKIKEIENKITPSGGGKKSSEEAEKK